MIVRIKSVIKSILFYDSIRATLFWDIINCFRNSLEIRKWEKKGKFPPPPHGVKVRTVKQYAKVFSIGTLIETGTLFGEMVWETRKTFSRIFSIELDDKLYMKAKERFSKYKHISIIHGDSSEVLPSLLNNISERALFWLDAHYSGGITAKGKLETPIVQEIDHILGHPNSDHIILIDDAHEFIGKNDYPTIDEMKSMFNYSKLYFEVKDNIICIHKIFK